MPIESLDDLRELAEPLVERLGGTVLAGDPREALDAEDAIFLVRARASRDARRELRELDPDSFHEWTAARQARLEVLAEGRLDELLDLVDLELARERAEAEASPAIAAAEIPPGRGYFCGRCGTASPIDVHPCPVCRVPFDFSSAVAVALPVGRSTPGPDAPQPEELPTMRSAARSTVKPAAAPPVQLEPLEAFARPVAGEAAGGRLVAVDLVDPSPFQRRTEFDPDTLETLADSIKRLGVLQPILVRPKADGRLELVAGERRLRAAKLAGLAEIPANVRELSDAEAAEACAVENLDREDLNAIEEAETLRVLLETSGRTQAQLAERIGRTQAHISNRLRLLELPDAWRARIISREIPPTHARELLAWKHRPAVLEKVAKALGNRTATKQPTPSVAEFSRIVKDAARDASRPVAEYYCGFKVTAARKAELDVEAVELSWGGSEERAFNVAAWNKLKKEADAKRKAAAATSTSSAGGAAAARPATFGPDPWVVEDAVAAWLARELRRKLRKSDRELALRLLLLFAGGNIADDPWIDTELPKVLELGVERDGLAVWRALAALEGAKLSAVVFDLVGRLLGAGRDEDDGFARGYNARALGEILAAVGGDPLAYPLTAADLELFRDEQLAAMPGAAELDGKPTKGERIDAILEARGTWLPEAFRDVLAPPKPKAKGKAKAKSSSR